MGTPIPPPPVILPIPPGNPCSVCWGIGKEFGSGSTPIKIFVTIEGVEKGPLWLPVFGEPLNGDFLLEQTDLFPCRYEYPAIGSLRVEVRFLFDRTIVSAFSDTGFLCFTGDPMNICQTLFPNQETLEFKNGTFLITIPEIV